MAQTFSIRRKIRFSHCDPAGIVYFAHFFDFIGGCVEDWFADAIGFDYATMHLHRRVGFPIVNTQCQFMRPCHLGDYLVIDLQIVRLGRSSVDFSLRGQVGEEKKFEGRHKVAMISLDTLKSIPIPDDLRASMHPFLA
jgi:4-hydroxybenzoyl-CoA thioesterase